MASSSIRQLGEKLTSSNDIDPDGPEERTILITAWKYSRELRETVSLCHILSVSGDDILLIKDRPPAVVLVQTSIRPTLGC